MTWRQIVNSVLSSCDNGATPWPVYCSLIFPVSRGSQNRYSGLNGQSADNKAGFGLPALNRKLM